MARRVFVGDVHGCLDALERLLEAVEFRAGTDVLMPVGDLVNKGPDSIGVLRRCVDLGALSVLGNHDLLWLEQRRIEDPALVDWLRAQPVTRVDHDLIVVHAALHPHWKVDELQRLDAEQRGFAVSARYCDADGHRPPGGDWPVPDPPYLPWDSFYRGAQRVVFGHWARRGFDRTDSVLALDSGCVYGGSLTAWVAEEDRVVQVPGLA